MTHALFSAAAGSGRPGLALAALTPLVALLAAGCSSASPPSLSQPAAKSCQAGTTFSATSVVSVRLGKAYGSQVNAKVGDLVTVLALNRNTIRLTPAGAGCVAKTVVESSGRRLTEFVLLQQGHAQVANLIRNGSGSAKVVAGTSLNVTQ